MTKLNKNKLESLEKFADPILYGVICQIDPSLKLDDFKTSRSKDPSVALKKRTIGTIKTRIADQIPITQIIALIKSALLESVTGEGSLFELIFPDPQKIFDNLCDILFTLDSEVKESNIEFQCLDEMYKKFAVVYSSCYSSTLTEASISLPSIDLTKEETLALISNIKDEIDTWLTNRLIGSMVPAAYVESIKQNPLHINKVFNLAQHINATLDNDPDAVQIKKDLCIFLSTLQEHPSKLSTAYLQLFESREPNSELFISVQYLMSQWLKHEFIQKKLPNALNALSDIYFIDRTTKNIEDAMIISIFSAIDFFKTHTKFSDPALPLQKLSEAILNTPDQFPMLELENIGTQRRLNPCTLQQQMERETRQIENELINWLISFEKQNYTPTTILPGIQDELSLRRLDSLASVLQPLNYSQCVAVAIDFKSNQFIIGSNANSEGVCSLIHTSIATRLALIKKWGDALQDQAKAKAKNDPEFPTDITRRRAEILTYLTDNEIDTFIAMGGYKKDNSSPKGATGGVKKVRDELKEKLVKIIDSYVYNPDFFGCDQKTIKSLFTNPQIITPKAQFVLAQKDLGDSIKINGIHCEQLVLLEAIKRGIPLFNNNIGITKLCCVVCWNAIKKHFPHIQVAGGHGLLYEGTIDCLETVHILYHESYIFHCNGSLERQPSGLSPRGAHDVWSEKQLQRTMTEAQRTVQSLPFFPQPNSQEKLSPDGLVEESSQGLSTSANSVEVAVSFSPT